MNLFALFRSTCKNRIGVYIIIALALFLPVISVAQSDLCGAAPTLTSAPGCLNTAGSLPGAAGYTVIPGLGCGVANDDVWYTFRAASSTPTITLSGVTVANVRLQLFSGTCASLTSLACGNTSIAAAGLTPGNNYLIRIYSTTNATGNFNICITDLHNVCASAVTLFPSTACNNVPGNMYGSTLTAPTTINPVNCASGVPPTRDVWYRFVAQTTNPTITLSSVGVNLSPNVGMQLLSNNCGAAFTSFYCGTTSIAANHLTPGTTYFIRVYSTSVPAPITTVGWGFDICVQDPVTPPPPNDECTGAVNVSVNNACSNINSDMAGATASGTPLGGACVGPNAYDVWFKFTAVNTTATVALSGMGTNFLNPRIEMFSGTCGSLTSIFCGASPLAAAGLTAGNTYYIRVYSTTAPPPNGNARFNICITSAALPVVRFGNSYVNISKRTTGGVVEPGDTLEIRMTMQHSTATVMTNLRFLDNLPTNTAMLTGATDRIRVITNEGLPYKQYTLAGGDDAATYLAAPPVGQFNIRMNLGFGASNPGVPANNTNTEFASATGTMVNTNFPRGGGTALLFATAYRVVATGPIGSTITLNPARFIYRAGGPDITLTGTSYQIQISEPLSLCSNSIGVNNATESGGTFGSGNTLNRPTDLTIPISGYSFMNNISAYNGLGDGRYAIVKNISPRSGTNRNANRVGVPGCGTLAYDDLLNCNNRMHGGHWDIDGDHSGTTNSIGNTPPDAATPSGYMLMVNADYVASEVFSQTLNNLCPDTYYEFSAWFRNICPTCGVDSVGQQFSGTPTAPLAGYPGVYPNLSFALDGLDYYSTGEIPLGGWLKKGFVFRTGPAQTSASFSIRNNSQGGGGNDWVMDDIAVATCLPTMSYSPTINPNVCQANPIEIADTISSFFDNYTSYKWQRSTDGGANWADITGVTTLPDTNYYITTYTVPPASTTLADSGDLYRVVVATTPANLVDPNCNISDGITITLSVMDCGPVLDVDLLTFNGRLVNTKANLAWSTSHEDSPVTFIIERSTDGRNFIKAGESPGYNNDNNANHYAFIDPVAVVARVWYRIKMVTLSGKKKYSNIIQLYNRLIDFDITSIVNPFSSGLTFEVTVAENSVITSELIDMSGKTVSKVKQLVYSGTNSLTLNTQSLPAGIYTLRVVNKNKYLVKRVVKKN